MAHNYKRRKQKGDEREDNQRELRTERRAGEGGEGSGPCRCRDTGFPNDVLILDGKGQTKAAEDSRQTSIHFNWETCRLGCLLPKSS